MAFEKVDAGNHISLWILDLSQDLVFIKQRMGGFGFYIIRHMVCVEKKVNCAFRRVEDMELNDLDHITFHEPFSKGRQQCMVKMLLLAMV